MRNFKIVLMVLTLFFVGMAISDAAKSKPDDSEWYAQIWDYDVESDRSDQLWSVFKAIELKKEKEYIPALEKFLKIRRLNSPRRAQAIYTMHKLGVKNSEEIFNFLLLAKTHFDTKLWPGELDEKYDALKFMNELDVSVSPKAIEVIKADIAIVLNLKYPRYAINLVAGLNLNGIELSDEEKELVADECLAKWRNIVPETLKQSGIKPDWESISKEERGTDVKFRMRFFKLLDLILASSDEDLRRKYVEKQDYAPDEHGKTKFYRTIIASTLGDQDATQSLIDNMQFDYILNSKLVLDSLPDELLLAMLEYEDANPRLNET